MTRFLTKLIVLSLVFIGSYCFFVDKLSTTHVDEHYYKFTQEASGLILGISRAGEGINPSMLEKELDSYGPVGSIVNFALNKYQSPYGEIYLNAIKEKLSVGNNSFFILSISPGNFVAPNYLNDQEILDMDMKMSIGKIDNFTRSPNYDYILNCYSRPLYTALLQDKSSNPIFHKNGWQEARLESPELTITAELMADWKTLNIREYHRILKRESLSEYRIEWFRRIIDFLKDKGQVHVVRMPADCEIIEDENEEWPDFGSRFKEISMELKVPFYDYTASCDQYTFYDGSHMASESANRFSIMLARDIKDHLDKVGSAKYPVQ